MGPNTVTFDALSQNNVLLLKQAQELVAMTLRCNLAMDEEVAFVSLAHSLRLVLALSAPSIGSEELQG